MSLGDSEVRLELIGRTPVWEFLPSPLHQITVDQLRSNLKPSPVGSGACACFSLADTYIRFGDGSLRRPDIAVYCNAPSHIGREALTDIPGAVIEVLSPEGEAKDLQLGPPAYLANGVLDVVVVDPETGLCTHFTETGSKTLRRGEWLQLQIGCQLLL